VYIWVCYNYITGVRLYIIFRQYDLGGFSVIYSSINRSNFDVRRKTVDHVQNMHFRRYCHTTILLCYQLSLINYFIIIIIIIITNSEQSGLDDVGDFFIGLFFSLAPRLSCNRRSRSFTADKLARRHVRNIILIIFRCFLLF